MAEIRAEHQAAAGAGQRERQIAGSTTDIEHAGPGPFHDVAHPLDRIGAPVTVDVEGEQMVGQVVAVRHAGEHVAHPKRCFTLVARAFRRGAVHDSANRIASSTSGSPIPFTTSAAPMWTGST